MRNFNFRQLKNGKEHLYNFTKTYSLRRHWFAYKYQVNLDRYISNPITQIMKKIIIFRVFNK